MLPTHYGDKTMPVAYQTFENRDNKVYRSTEISTNITLSEDMEHICDAQWFSFWKWQPFRVYLYSFVTYQNNHQYRSNPIQYLDLMCSTMGQMAHHLGSGSSSQHHLLSCLGT